MPKFLSDGLFSGTSTDLEVGGTLDVTGKITTASHIELAQYGYLDFGTDSNNRLQLFNSLSGATLKQWGAGDLNINSVDNSITFLAGVSLMSSSYGLKVVGASIQTPAVYELGDTSVYLDLGNTTTSLKTAGPIITTGVNQFKSVGGTGSAVAIELKGNSSESNSDYLAKSTIYTRYDTTTPYAANNNSMMLFKVGKGTDAFQHTVLTLDSSLGATFAGDVTVTGSQLFLGGTTYGIENVSGNYGVRNSSGDYGGNDGTSAYTTPQDFFHIPGTLRVGPKYATSDRDYIKFIPAGSTSTIEMPNENAYIHNNQGNIVLRTGASTDAVTVTGANTTFAGTIGATNFSGSSSGTNTGDQDLSGYLTSLPSHNHDTRYTSTDASGDNYTFEIEDEGSYSGNKWYHVATINSGNGGLHIRGAMLNHVENFASQKFDLAIQVREANDGGQLEITGTVHVLHNESSGTDKCGIRILKTAENGNYDEFKAYIRTTRYQMLTLRLTQQGQTTFNTSHSSPLTTEPAPISGGHVEIDTSTLAEGNYVVDDSTPKEIGQKNDDIASLAFSGTTTKTLTLTKNDGNTITGTFADTGGTSGITQSDADTRYVNVTGDAMTGNLTLNTGSQLILDTAAGNERGYIQATDTNDAHLIIATSGGEDIAFKDGGLSGTTNFLIRGDGSAYTTQNHYARAYYDSVSTGYFLDPGGTSNSYAANLRGRVVVYDEQSVGGNLSLRNLNRRWYGGQHHEPGQTILTSEHRSDYVVGNGRAVTALVLGNTPWGTAAASSGKDIFNITRVNQAAYGPSTGQGTFGRVLNLRGNGDLYLGVNNTTGAIYATKYYDKTNTSYYLDPATSSKLAGIITLDKNTATGLANSTFSHAKTIIGGIHFANGNGPAANNGNQAAITFQGSSASEAQAGIYVHNNNSEGTHMMFATTNSYATGPQAGITLLNNGNVTIRGTITASGYNKTNWDTAYGWGDHASAGYLTSVPSNASALNLNAVDDRDMAPEDLSYSDDLRIFFSAREGLEDGTSTGSDWHDVLVLNSYSDSSGGNANVLAFDKNSYKIRHYQAGLSDSNWGTAKVLAYTSDIPTNNNQLSNGAGYLTSSSTQSKYLRSDTSDTTSGGLTISGSVDSGGTDMGFYESAGTNLILKGDSNGRSGIFFESEKDGTNINDPTDYGFIQFHSYGHGNTTGESAAMVIGVSNDSADKLILQTPYNGGVMVGYKDGTSGTGLTLSEVIHSNASSYNNGNWDTAYGWGNHASAGYLTALPSHTHDDRYYTETEMRTFFDRGYIESVSASNLAVGWYTIATNTGDRALGEFQIWDTASSDHQSVLFSASHHFGTDTSNDITVTANSRYSGTNFRYIRIKDHDTYAGAALQVYVDGATNSVYAAIVGGNAQMSGWDLKNWVADATDPGDLSNYSSFGERAKVDLDLTINGGMITTGDIYAGSQTTQNKVFHAGNFTDNSSNWNTAYGWGNHASAGYISSFDITTQTDAKYLRSNAADTATHRIVFSGCDTNNHDTIATGTGSLGSIEIYNTGSGKDAFMTFHVGGDYACYFGLDGGTNKLSVGGWSMGAASYEIYHAGNKPSLSTLGYTGATNANYITNNNQLTNGAGYITSSALSGYATTSSTVDKANGLAEVGYGTDEGTFQQLSSSFAGFTGGWANYFIGNHGNGSNYYNTVHIMPFWGPPKYSRLENNSLKGPFNYLTDEVDTVTSKYLQSNSSLRAPIFYDSNDTNYYIDPNGTSKLSTIQNVKIQNIGKSPIGTGYGSGKLLGYNSVNSSGRAAATLGVNEQGYVMEYEKIMTFKISGNGWVNRSSNPYKLIQAPGADKMIVVDEFLVYIDYATRTGLGSNGIALSYEQAAYSVGFYLNETGQSISTANHGVSSTFYTSGIMPAGFMNTSLDRGYYRDVPVHQSALIANRSLFFKTSRNCSSSSNAPGGAHYIKIKYRVIDISEEFNAAGCNQTIDVSNYHGQYAHDADGEKRYNDAGQATF